MVCVCVCARARIYIYVFFPTKISSGKLFVCLKIGSDTGSVTFHPEPIESLGFVAEHGVKFRVVLESKLDLELRDTGDEIYCVALDFFLIKNNGNEQFSCAQVSQKQQVLPH